MVGPAKNVWQNSNRGATDDGDSGGVVKCTCLAIESKVFVGRNTRLAFSSAFAEMKLSIMTVNPMKMAYCHLSNVVWQKGSVVLRFRGS